MKKAYIATALLSFISASAFSAEYILPYKKENHWVAKEDASMLRQLIKTAKSKKIKHFYVQLPEEKRDVSIQRLLILRDILEKQVKSGIILEEIDGTNKANSLVIHTTKP